MSELELQENILTVHLLLRAIADEPEIFMDIIGEHDYSVNFVTGYLEGLLDIIGDDVR